MWEKGEGASLPGSLHYPSVTQFLQIYHKRGVGEGWGGEKGEGWGVGEGWGGEGDGWGLRMEEDRTRFTKK